MTGPYENQVLTALRATRITSPLSFCWFDHEIRVLPKSFPRLPGSEARRLLVRSLASTLYSSFYATGEAVRVAPHPHLSASPESCRLVDALTRANTGSGCWESGWELLEQRGHEVVLRRDGLTLHAPLDSCRRQENDRWSDVEVRFPSEMLGISPGFYMAVGDVQIPPGPGLVRLYWNVAIDGAVELVARTTAALNAAGVPFRLKVANALPTFARCDAAVLYLPAHHFRASRKLLRRIQRELASTLRPTVPAFTKKLGSGVGLAEDPMTGDSFGMHRCGILAEAIVAAHDRGDLSEPASLSIVAETFTDQRLTLECPYLNSGSADSYAWV